MLLHDLGLEQSVWSLATALSGSNTRVRTRFAISVPRLAEAVEVGVYRIIEEALTNACRHGGRSRWVAP